MNLIHHHDCCECNKEYICPGGGSRCRVFEHLCDDCLDRTIFGCASSAGDPRGAKIAHARSGIPAEQGQRPGGYMPSATSLIKSGGGGNLLKGSSLSMKQSRVTIKIMEARESPDGFKAPMILDIEPTREANAFPLNVTNLRKCVELMGDDFSKWKGQSLTLRKILTRNPSSGAYVDSLAVESVEKALARKKKKRKSSTGRPARSRTSPET